MQHAEHQGKFLESNSIADRLQVPLSKLAALVRLHPEGTLSFADNALAAQYKNEMAPILNEVATGGTRYTEVDKQAAEARLAGLGIWNAVSGATDAQMKAMQGFIDTTRHANKGLLHQHKGL